MARSLADLKKQSTSLLAKIKDSEDQKASSFKDSRIWKPKFDKTKAVSHAIIRFLPACPTDTDDLPYVCVSVHQFKMNGQYYNERSLTNLGQKDPANEIARALYASEFQSDKDLAGKFKKRPNYYANILVIDDPVQPENNGKVFLFKFTKQIFDILKSKMFPEFEGDVALNPFSPYEGANFEIRITPKTVGKEVLPNYEKSFFRQPSAISDDDDEIQAIWDKCYSLQELTDKKHYTKTYEELTEKLVNMLGHTVGSGIPVSASAIAPAPVRQSKAPAKTHAKTTVEESDDVPFEVDDDIPDFSVSKPAIATPSKSAASKPAKKEEVEDDDLEFFRNL